MSRAGLLSGLLVLAAVPITRGDDLDRILARDKIRAQKIATDVSYALAQSSVLEKVDAGAALDILQKAQTQLRDADVLPESQRQDFLRRLQARTNQVRETLRIRENEAAAKARAEAAQALRDRPAPPPGPGKTGTGPADIAKRYTGSVRDQVAAAERLRAQRAGNNLSIFNQLAASATTIEGVVEYPRHWEWIVKNRLPGGGTRLTEKEVNLLKALNSTLSVDFPNTRFRDVLEYLSEKTGQAILVDEGSLREAMVEYDDAVKFQAKKVTFRTILRKVLADRGLTYILKEGTIHVVTPQKARDTMVVRVYPVEDLLGGSDPRFDPLLNRFFALQRAQGFVNMIQNAIEPALWNVNGGPGSIILEPNSLSLVVRAPAELHYMLGSGSLLGR